MRKLVWGCFTAALAVSGVSLWLFDYACGHPDSWPGRCCYGARRVVVSQVRTAEATRRTAEVVLHGVQGLFAPGADAVCPDDKHCAAQPAPVAEDGCNLEPAVLPGAVVMHEDEGMLPAQPLPAVSEFVGGAEECEEVPMPRAEEEAAKMPTVEEFEAGCQAVPTKSKGRECHPASEECEPLLPKVRQDGGEMPRHPEVDTMEVRPSDLRFADFAGPF